MVKLKTGDSSGEYELIPENEIVNARVGGVEPNEFLWNEEEVKKLRWTFVIDEPESKFHGQNVWGDTSQAFVSHPNCKAYNWTAAITGRQYDSGEELDTDDLLGLPCRIMIFHKEDKKTNLMYMRAKEVFPPSKIGANQGPKDSPF